MLLRKSFVHDEDVCDNQQVDAGREHMRLAAAAVGDFGGLRVPGNAAGKEIAAVLHIVKKQIARCKCIRAINQVQLVGVWRCLQVRQHVDSEARFLGKITNEEIGLGELGRSQDFSFQRIDALYLAEHDYPICAAGLTYLRGDDDLKLLAINREHISSGGGGGHFATVQCRPAFFFTHREMHQKAVLFEEH